MNIVDGVLASEETPSSIWTYNIEEAPRSASFGPGALLGPLGGAIDASLNENAGAFQMRFVKGGGFESEGICVQGTMHD